MKVGPDTGVEPRMGKVKTDARDAYVIADAARILPHTLRRVDTGDDALAELEMLVGYDDDLAGEAIRTRDPPSARRPDPATRPSIKPNLRLVEMAT